MLRNNKVTILIHCLIETGTDLQLYREMAVVWSDSRQQYWNEPRSIPGITKPNYAMK